MQFAFLLFGVVSLALLAGLFLIVRGLLLLKRNGKKQILRGLSVIAITVLLASWFAYSVQFQRGGHFDELRKRGATRDLNALFQLIESYRSEHATYPASLEELRASLLKDAKIPVRDSTTLARDGAHPSFFYKRVDGQHYYLLGVGSDAVPFTDDDMHPDFGINTSGSIGLIRTR